MTERACSLQTLVLSLNGPLRLARTQEPDAGNLRHLLRLGDERRGEETASQGTDERPSIHPGELTPTGRARDLRFPFRLRRAQKRMAEVVAALAASVLHF
jgi:hypothetical protein